MIRWLLIVLLLLITPLAQAVIMTLSQPQIEAGGRLDMLVETRSSQAEEPELEWPSSWDAHLLLVDRHHQVQQLPRGDYQHRWLLTWEHQQPDSISRTLQLPPLSVQGQEAQLLRLKIQARRPPRTAAQPPLDPLQISHSITSQQVYPGQSLLYELVIRYQGYPSNPRLSQLEVEGGHSRSLGEGKEEGYRDRGLHWQEARWQEIVQIREAPARIQPRYFSTRLNRAGQSGGQLYEAQTSSLELEVLPLPTSWPDRKTWLPAEEVSVSARWSDLPGVPRVGQPLELEVRLLATGQQSRSLPLFQPPSRPDFQVERLSEERKDRVLHGQLEGELLQKLLIYPAQAGDFQLPPLEVDWWNTRRHQRETLRVDLPPLRVEAALNPSEVAAPITGSGEQVSSASFWWRLALALVWVGVLALILAAAVLAYRQTNRARLKRYLHQGPDTWSHAELLDLAQSWGLQKELEPLMVQAAAGKAMSRKALQQYLLAGKKKNKKGAALPPLNP
ncbi:BatD family protein [Marinospirillum perlucidum]|uniref:BatD family protein n=1 Tax=Marinospirillum perlucidum TaxID=1982602 RepID=UPI000DF15DC0|nr:BatD family protein [Marinospirillum perlucidum]